MMTWHNPNGIENGALWVNGVLVHIENYILVEPKRLPQKVTDKLEKLPLWERVKKTKKTSKKASQEQTSRKKPPASKAEK